MKLWHETQPESVAEFYEIADQKILPEIRQECLQKGLREVLREGLREGRQVGLREGRQEGRQESMKEVAERMISKGMVDSDIHVFTQLSLEEIAKLRNGARE